MNFGRIAARLVADALVSRVTERLAFEFPSQEALREYLKDHPNADRSLHYVDTDKEKKSLAIRRETQLKHLVKEESAKQWERDSRAVDEHVTGLREHVSTVMNSVPKVAQETRDAVAQFSREREKELPEDFKSRRKELRKELKKQVVAALKDSSAVKGIADRYLLEEKTVQDAIANFVTTGGGEDTQVDLEKHLETKARVAYQAKIVSESRQTGIIPDELLGFVPSKLGFRIDNKHHVQLVEHFGNQEKTMVAKVHEMRLLLMQKNDIMEKVAKDLNSDDERKRMLALITGLGIHTGIRTGSEVNHIEVVDPQTGEKTEEKTYGATTLLAQHVQVTREGVTHLEFKGKKGTVNAADIDDAELTHHLLEFTRGKNPDQPVFVTKEGKKISAESVNDYIKEFGITFTDFRKFRGTKEVFDGLKRDMEHMYREIAEKADANRRLTREKVVKVLFEHLKKIFEEAQHRLSHEDVDVTIDSYVNPMVVLNMLSTGKAAQTMEEAIEENGEINFNLDAILAEAKKYMKEKTI